VALQHDTIKLLFIKYSDLASQHNPKKAIRIQPDAKHCDWTTGSMSNKESDTSAPDHNSVPIYPTYLKNQHESVYSRQNTKYCTDSAAE
jgi:hypothetical protein